MKDTNQSSAGRLLALSPGDGCAQAPEHRAASPERPRFGLCGGPSHSGVISDLGRARSGLSKPGARAAQDGESGPPLRLRPEQTPAQAQAGMQSSPVRTPSRRRAVGGPGRLARKCGRPSSCQVSMDRKAFICSSHSSPRSVGPRGTALPSRTATGPSPPHCESVTCVRNKPATSRTLLPKAGQAPGQLVCHPVSLVEKLKPRDSQVLGQGHTTSLPVRGSLPALARTPSSQAPGQQCLPCPASREKTEENGHPGPSGGSSDLGNGSPSLFVPLCSSLQAPGRFCHLFRLPLVP